MFDSLAFFSLWNEFVNMRKRKNWTNRRIESVQVFVGLLLILMSCLLLTNSLCPCWACGSSHGSPLVLECSPRMLQTYTSSSIPCLWEEEEEISWFCSNTRHKISHAGMQSYEVGFPKTKESRAELVRVALFLMFRCVTCVPAWLYHETGSNKGAHWTEWSTIQGIIALHEADLKLWTRLLSELYNTGSNY